VRGELHDVLRELALPTLLVTHDFEDAAAVADRIGVISEGRVRQVGTAAELLGAPRDDVVASFADFYAHRNRDVTEVRQTEVAQVDMQRKIVPRAVVGCDFSKDFFDRGKRRRGR